MAEEAASRRVKVYQLNDDGQWDDKGTGHIHHGSADDGDGEFIILTVMCEESGDILLEHRVEDSIAYHRQGDTILTWCEEATDIDLALSFQDVGHCTEVWDQISAAQSKSGSELLSQEDSNNNFEGHDYSEGGMLPFPNLSNLSEVCGRINQFTLGNKDLMVNTLLSEGYMPKLFELFESVEDLDQFEEALVVFNIFKGIFMLNDLAVFELLLSDAHIMSVIAPLEYDPNLAQGTSYTRHRDFLKSVEFKEVVPLKDEEVVSKIHQNYRITYIKDVILLRYLDDATMSTLSQMIFFNNVTIVSRLSENTEFLKEFFAQIHQLASFTGSKKDSYISQISSKKKKEADGESDESKSETRKGLFKFLQELCGLAKTLQIPMRDTFYKKLSNVYGLFRAIEDALVASSPESELWLWLTAADILTNVLNHDPGLLRNYLVTRLSVPNSMLGCLVDNVVQPVGSGLADQLAQILRMVLDPDSMQSADNKDSFLDHFYARQIGKITAALNAPVRKRTHWTADSPAYQACELLSFCVHNHGYRIKQYILNNDIMSKTIKLVKVQQQPNVVCSAVRFLRTCVGLKDDMIIRRMVSKKIISEIMDVFAENGSRYNLLNSAIIEMVNFIRQENIKPLCKELVTQHASKFDHVEYVQTFKDLHLRYEQNQEFGAGENGDGGDGEETAQDGEYAEYNYFNEDSDDEDKKNAAGLSASEQSAFDKAHELIRQKRKLEQDDGDLLSNAKRKAPVGGVISSGPTPPSKTGGGGISFDLSKGKNSNWKKKR